MILREYHGEIEADLRQTYQVRLRDFWRGKITARELWTLISQLPAESRFQAALANWQEQAKTDRKHAALEAQLERNRERGLIK